MGTGSDVFQLTLTPSCSPRRFRSSAALTRRRSRVELIPNAANCLAAKLPGPHPGILVAGVEARREETSRRRRTRTPLGFARFVDSLARNCDFNLSTVQINAPGRDVVRRAVTPGDKERYSRRPNKE